MGAPPPVRPQPARVAHDLALALQIQAEIDAERLTYREVAPRHGCSRQRVCRLLTLTRLAPDIQQAVARLTTETASDPLDREALEWVAEVIDWSEQRERFQKVMVRAFGTEPSPVAQVLSDALRIKQEIDAQGLTLAEAARANALDPERLRQLLDLTRLAPDIQGEVLATTMATVCWYVSAPKLRLIAAEPAHAEQRRLYEKILAGQLTASQRPRDRARRRHAAPAP